MARETSIATYRKIEAEGLLSRRRWEVYKVLFAHGPLTGNEVFEHLKVALGRSFRVDSNTHSRLTELRDCDATFEVGERVCSVTGRNVILWDVTNRLPAAVKADTIATRKELIETLSQLVEEVYPRINLATEKGVLWTNKAKTVLEQCQRHRKAKKNLIQ